MDEDAEDRLTYRGAGVDIERAAALVSRIKAFASPTHTPAVLGGIGGFGALFELPIAEYRRPVLVSGTDGVGTKLRLAIDLALHDTVGIDLVAMCVNDILVLGAKPLFFLDYYATGRLDLAVAESVIRGIARGCEAAGAALVGGETAELPGMFAGADYDLAGFCVGVVEKERIIDGRRAAPGQVLLGVASSGPHSNGYSLIRKVLQRSGADAGSRFGNRSLAEVLLEPTRIYAKSVGRLIEDLDVRAIAHITGGGLVENIPRVLPVGTRARIDTAAWERPPVFDWLQTEGRVEDREMLRTFNCGIGLVVCVSEEDADEAKRVLESNGEEVAAIGAVEASPDPTPGVVFARAAAR